MHTLYNFFFLFLMAFRCKNKNNPTPNKNATVKKIQIYISYPCWKIFFLLLFFSLYLCKENSEMRKKKIFFFNQNLNFVIEYLTGRKLDFFLIRNGSWIELKRRQFMNFSFKRSLYVCTCVCWFFRNFMIPKQSMILILIFD